MNNEDVKSLETSLLLLKSDIANFENEDVKSLEASLLLLRSYIANFEIEIKNKLSIILQDIYTCEKNIDKILHDEKLGENMNGKE